MSGKSNVPGLEQFLEQEKMGWVSPSYETSRSVRLEPKVMAENRCVAFQGGEPEADAYRVLRTRILHRIQKGRCNTLMVTSALPGEGKTLTAINLALSFSKEFSQTVLLVDCDLRRQSVHEVLGYQAEKGLVNYLVDGEPLTDLIVWPGIEKLTVISGGRTMTDSSELLGSPGMNSLVSEMKSRYQDRLIIFDVPPLFVGADALAFAPLVDHILMIVRAEKTSGKDVANALKLLPQGKVLGTVLNCGRAKADMKYPAKYLDPNRKRGG